MKRLAWALLALTFGAAPAVASGCRDLDHGGNRYTVCEVDAGAEDLRLFLYRPDGTPWGQFSAVNAALRPEGQLAFAMNAGMYHDDRSPVGHYVENGEEIMPATLPALCFPRDLTSVLFRPVLITCSN